MRRSQLVAGVGAGLLLVVALWGFSSSSAASELERRLEGESAALAIAAEDLQSCKNARATAVAETDAARVVITDLQRVRAWCVAPG